MSRILTLQIYPDSGRYPEIHWKSDRSGSGSMSFADLGSLLKAESLKMDDMFVVVQVEGTTSYDHFVQILDELYRNGIDTIGLKRMSDHGPLLGTVIGVHSGRTFH